MNHRAGIPERHVPSAGECDVKWLPLVRLARGGNICPCLLGQARYRAAFDDSERTLFTAVLFSFRFCSSSRPHTLILGSLVSEKYLVCLKEQLVLLVVRIFQPFVVLPALYLRLTMRPWTSLFQLK